MKKKVLDQFYEIITPNKRELFDRVASLRTKHITVVLENIFQEHNASAVLRTCDCFGIQDLHVVEKNNQYKVQRDIARGAGQWVDIYNYNKGDKVVEDCLKKLKEKGYQIVATSPHAIKTVNELDLHQPTAFVFGTEWEGISDEAERLSDELIKIPMYGFTESFNVSVSVALVLNAVRTKLDIELIDWKMTDEEIVDLKTRWCKKIVKEGDKVEKYFLKKK